MKKKNIVYSICVLLGAAFIVWSMLYQAGTLNGATKIAPGAAELPPDHTQWTELKEATVPLVYSAVGTVRSRETVDIISRLAAARILEVKVRSGDAVKAGDLLVKLEDTDLKAALDTAQENLKAAQSRLEFAENEFNRNRKLVESNAIARRVYEQAESNYNASRAEVSMLNHMLENARANLSYSELRAPFDGIVAERFNDPGDLATPQAILTFFDPSKLQLRIPIREGLISKLKIGEKIPIEIEALKRYLTAEIKEIIPAVDPGSRTFSIDACLLGDTSGVMPGMFALCKVVVGAETILPVPERAIRRVGQLEYLRVKTTSGPVDQYITTAPWKEGFRKIVSGVQAGVFYDAEP